MLWEAYDQELETQHKTSLPLRSETLGVFPAIIIQNSSPMHASHSQYHTDAGMFWSFLRDISHGMFYENRADLMRCILWMRPANERRRYNVTSSLIGWAHPQKDPCASWEVILSRAGHVCMMDKNAQENLIADTPQACLSTVHFWNEIKLL